MRTKTLLLSAAALVAGLATSQAQVYSQNVVGYATLSLTPNAIQIISPTLDLDGTGTNGTVSTVLGTNCAVSTALYVFNGVGYDILQYTSTHHLAPPIWNIGGVATNNYPLNCGQSFWILDPSDSSVTLSGNVLQGALSNPYVSSTGNITMVADQVPLSGGVTTVLGYQPTVSDAIYNFNGVGYDIYTYTSTHHLAPPCWNIGGVSNEPQISVGQGFWLLPANSGEVWNQTFNVQ